MKTTPKRWKDLFKRLGCTQTAEKQFNRLAGAYSEKHRAYHNLNHIKQCLIEFDRVADRTDAPDLLEIAIWYHDAVYQIRSDRNEEESALLAEKELNQLGIPEKSIRIVSGLIVSTKHNADPEDSDTRYLLDIDLSILGAPPIIYREYEKNIRNEYKWVPEFLFRKKRSEILASFLKRETIYYTDFFRENYEEQARFNLQSALAAA